MIIAIDGPAGSGKTTTARRVAKSLGFMHINTGAMYRAITLKFILKKINIDDIREIDAILQNTTFNFTGPNYEFLYMDDKDISKKIISSNVTEYVSTISAISNVRLKLVEYQRNLAQDRNVVLEGRDIGTVVFPKADYKFYLIANIEVRATRRKKEMEAIGENLSIKETIFYLQNRDNKDSLRRNSPLMKAEDAIELDTTHLTIDEQVNHIISIVNNNQTGA